VSKLAVKNNRILRSQQALNAFITIVRLYLPLDLRNTRITAEDIIAILGYASVHRISMDAASHKLKEAPSANRLREVLAQALPDRKILQRALNTILRAQTPRFIKKGKRAYYIAIDLTLIPYHGELKVSAVAVKKYSKERYKRKGARWFAYAVAGLPKSVEPHQVFEMYRQRFGIETSHRQTSAPYRRCGVNQVRARTTSRNPVIRLLLVGLAFILFNLYIANRQRFAICLKNSTKPFSKFWLTLRRLARMLAQAVEHLFDLVDVVSRHSHMTFS
jgi:putative transposase